MSNEWLPPAFVEHLKDATRPSVLFHYTGQAGLLGIIERSEFWCTKVQYMNDATEFGRALEIARGKLTTMIAEIPDDIPNLSRRAACHEFLRLLDGLEEVNLFAVCFCEDGDLLSQWRGYSGGGQGYAIGFDVEMLCHSIEARQFTLGKCIYDPAIQDAIVEQAIMRCLEDELAFPPRTNRGFRGPLARILFQCGVFFKEPSFSEEREWRLVSSLVWFNDQQLCFRPGRSMIVPYYRLPFEPQGGLPVRSVVVGPCPHMQLSQWSVKALMMKNGVRGSLYGQEITAASKIPFRDW